MLLLSLRHKTNDHLWFTFFHEAGHLCLHGKKLLFVDLEGGLSTEQEDEANLFARDKLIPLQHTQTLRPLRSAAQVSDPNTDGIERYIGLEHLRPGDLRVRSWGEVSDGRTTFTTRVRPGQVLFGKRRAYQRKVAVADFDAVCSGDIYVFESANPAKLLPELLPFLCRTDAFFEHAVGTSAGSLSPRTNWTSLAEYQFVLPPLEEQRRIIDMLLATDRSTTRTRVAIAATYSW
ncbi:MAG: restriction endonuclease subunit S [Deltaproteobacteria bacterium]|nr:restriction endonuclease subunit S [Deltaproteobacteria bacterium]